MKSKLMTGGLLLGVLFLGGFLTKDLYAEQKAQNIFQGMQQACPSGKGGYCPANAITQPMIPSSVIRKQASNYSNIKQINNQQNTSSGQIQHKTQPAPKPKKSSYKLPKNSVRAKQLTDNTYIVKPEVTTIVKMSSSDINRIVYTGEIEKEIRVVYPKRKGVNVKVVNNNIFVEFEIKKIDEEYIYQETPVELYIICDSTVYSIIAFPKKIPAVTVYLENKAKSIKENLKNVAEMPFEKRVVEIVSNILTGQIPMEGTYKKIKKEYKIFPLIKMEESANIVFEAEGLVARVFYLTLKRNANLKEVDITEKDFLRKDVTVRPVAISLNKLKVRKGEKTMLVILEKKSVLGFDINSQNGFLLFN